MSGDKEYMTPLGFIITGFLMLAVAGLCITPSTMSIDNTNAFRMFGGIALVIIGILIFCLNRNGMYAAVMIANGLMFVLAAQVSLGSTRDFVMILFMVGYILMALMAVIGTERSYLVAAMFICITLNLVVRYIMGVSDDGISMFGGVFCLISAVLSMYIGLAMIDRNSRLPLF